MKFDNNLVFIQGDHYLAPDIRKEIDVVAAIFGSLAKGHHDVCVPKKSLGK